MLGGLTGWHLLALVVIILLLFGAAKLPRWPRASVSPRASSRAR
jgi:Sec-independent protein translocase protein TatA